MNRINPAPHSRKASTPTVALKGIVENEKSSLDSGNDVESQQRNHSQQSEVELLSELEASLANKKMTFDEQEKRRIQIMEAKLAKQMLLHSGLFGEDCCRFIC